MDNLFAIKQEANGLRKAKEYEKALPLYKEFWDTTADKFDGTGLLNCLRKTNNLEEASILVEELFQRFPDFSWCQKEVAWTLIATKLTLPVKAEKRDDFLNTAQRILDLNSDNITKERVVFTVVKFCNESKDWIPSRKWLLLIDPDSLSSDPILINGKKGWSKHYY
ncbi:tetratricopeptide repeat protein [Candidatus Formimonas warabiya]|uniref:Tetratricopeptide repeat protein n=1 Tax=Formimonas warabiya TaxID=1761012 RepID=A0A3G1KQ54_FORW1|nr:hypothetical protein [Candidatus Formimonas warabiya]ATW24578.1 hypothetical protein DCMF_07080 [Candidatus Formimonas warabiya]